MAALQRFVHVALTLALLALAGCNPAGPYNVHVTKRLPAPARETKDSAPEETKPPAPPPPLPPDYAWKEPTATLPDVPLEFVSADQEEWGKLDRFWNEVVLPGPAQFGNLAGAPLPGVPLAVQKRVQVKVPLGLDNPTRFIPDENRPTLAKWELGKQLFFDPSWLTPRGERSCASCHDPKQGFTGGKDPANRIAGLDPPTLLNVVYSGSLFGDGRAANLEEVTQRVLEDEREPASPAAEQPHVWSGVIKRLRDPSRKYTERFAGVFGTPPTQDAVGKALATYLRTILAGNSLHDRALQAMKGRSGTSLDVADYQKVLDPAALEALGSDAAHKDETARDLHAGYTLFFDLRRSNCIACHSGRTFTDNSFHNLGVGLTRIAPGKEPGRFAALPVGLKDLERRIGAYKTPTLRSLLRTAPYGHDGLAATLEAAVKMHVHPGALVSPYLDPEVRDLKLDDPEVRALVLFLRSLNGDAPAAILTETAP